MDAAKLLDDALRGQSTGYLQQRHAVFLADISDIAAMIGTLFAIPKVCDFNYRSLLDRDARIPLLSDRHYQRTLAQPARRRTARAA